MKKEQFNLQFKINNKVTCAEWKQQGLNPSTILSIHEFTFEAKDENGEITREFFNKHQWEKVS